MSSFVAFRSTSSATAVYFSFSVRKMVVGVLDSLKTTIGWNRDHIQLVDLPELIGFRHRGTRHTGDFVVQLEEVLQRDSG